MTTTPSTNNQATLSCVNSDFTSPDSISGDAPDLTPNVINLSDNLQLIPISSLNLQVNNNYGDSPNTNKLPQSNPHEATGTCQITGSVLHPYLTLEPYHPEESITLNYSDLGDLLTNYNTLPTHIQHKVRSISDKLRTKASDFWYDGYYPQTSLISLVESNVSQSVCRCGFKPGRSVSSPGLCHKPRLCLKCASLEARKSLNVFKPNFHNHSWGFLTISFHGDLPYSSTTSPADWWRYWDATGYGVRQLRKSGYIQGAILREEIKINSIAPIRVLPHLHAIVSSPDVSDGVIDELGFDVYSYLDTDGDGVALLPSIRFQPLLTEDDFERVWFYIYKPTLFYDAYLGKWNDDATPQAKSCLNRSMHEAIDATIHIPFRRRQIHYLGNMRSSNRDFIGVLEN